MGEWTAEAIEKRVDRRRDNTIQFVKTRGEQPLLQTKRELCPTRVVVQDVQISFFSMVNFMVKYAPINSRDLVRHRTHWLGAWLGPLVGVATDTH